MSWERESPSEDGKSTQVMQNRAHWSETRMTATISASLFQKYHSLFLHLPSPIPSSENYTMLPNNGKDVLLKMHPYCKVPKCKTNLFFNKLCCML
jgi:hypothetical protein